MNATKQLRTLFDAALKAVSPRALIQNAVTLKENTLYIQQEAYDLLDYENIYVFASGKAAFSTCEALEEILGSRITAGVAVGHTKHESQGAIKFLQATHPYVSQQSIDASQQFVQILKQLTSKDLFIYLLSGGSSSLLELPKEGVSLKDLTKANEIMVNNALDINEINTIRKHLSSIKGGQLARHTKASGVALVISDVIGDDLCTIGSAPFWYDDTTYEEAVDILHKKAIFDLMPASIQNTLQKGKEGKLKETPKEPSHIKHHLIGSNHTATQAVIDKAIELGLRVDTKAYLIKGEQERFLPKLIKLIDESSYECIVFGGESTLFVHGQGVGGRNQHLALSLLSRICAFNSDIAVLSAGTDGQDGNSSATGAIVSQETCTCAQKKGLSIEEYLENSDSFTFLDACDAVIQTGATYTNVMDIIIVLKGVKRV